jgi:two-component system, OmpR family, response regulator
MARILIVEDDPFFADVLACTLKLEGHDTTVANDACEGIRLGLISRPDVVIADWSLRNTLNGGEVCRRIRVICPRCKTIIITGHQELVSEALRYCDHAEAVIAKPFHKQEILGALRKALDHNVAPAPIKIFDPDLREDVFQPVC